MYATAILQKIKCDDQPLTFIAGTADANEALTISLVTPTETGIKKIESFNPTFTYPIFGEEERIFGYKGLRINLQYSASDLRPNLTVSSIRKFKSVGEVEAVDVVETLKEYLPGGWLNSSLGTSLLPLTEFSRIPKERRLRVRCQADSRHVDTTWRVGQVDRAEWRDIRNLEGQPRRQGCHATGESNPDLRPILH